MLLTCADIIIYLEDKYVDIVHSNVTHIFNAVIHVDIMDMHIL